MTKHEHYETRLSIDTHVIYDVLPETADFPEQIDLLKVIVNVGGRQVNILRALDESSLLALEDEIRDSLWPGGSDV